MSVIGKIFFDPKHRKRGLILAFTIFGISVSVITTTVVLHLTNQVQKFPKFKTQPDLPTQPLTTYQESKSWTFPDEGNNFQNSTCAVSGNNWVVTENQKPGVDLKESDWRQVDFKYAAGSALWIDRTSANCGDTIKVHASLYMPKIFGFVKGKRTIHVLRIGWYNGSGAREVWSSSPISLKTFKINKPVNNLRMVETTWPTTLQFTIGADWTPGFYLVVSEDPNGKFENAAPFVLHAPLGSSKIILMHSFLTWNLYNTFGNRSAYLGSGDNVATRREDRSRVVSLDRPIIGSGGYSIHRDGISMVQFLEKSGFDFDQVSDFDLDTNPSIVKSYNELILSGHAEYMTRRIFEGVIAARNDGVNLAIFGGNTALWQTRTTESPTGKNRRIIMYRSATEDPVSDLRQVTIEFANHRLNMPQSLFTGTHPNGTHVYGNLKSVKIPSWLPLPSYASIDGISPDSEIEASSQGSEAAPPKVNIILSGNMNYADPTTKPAGKPLHPESDVVWFTDENGQATFNAGITTWACDLVDTCAYSSVDDKSRQVLDTITKTVVTLWQERKIGAKLTN